MIPCKIKNTFYYRDTKSDTLQQQESVTSDTNVYYIAGRAEDLTT